MTLDPDPLVPDGWLMEVVARGRATRAHRIRRRRLLLAVLIGGTFLAGSLAGHALASTPRPTMTAIPTPDAAESGSPPAGSRNLSWSTEAPTPGVSLPLPTVTASPWPAAGVLTPRTTAALVSGIASWGYGWAGVVTRLPRGTRITVCGALGCWSGRSVGFGPAVWTHRIADLSRSVFAAICGAPSKGLCRVTLTW